MTRVRISNEKNDCKSEKIFFWVREISLCAKLADDIVLENDNYVYFDADLFFL